MLQKYMRQKFAQRSLDQLLYIPQIPPQPAAAIESLVQGIETLQQHHSIALAGSSLGGFYATWLAERYACKAVLINPAVRPDRLLQKYLGDNINYYTSEHWILDERHIEQFRELDIEPVTRPERYLLMLQTGDETLDYREAVKKYRDCPGIIEQGGNHSFDNFEQHIEAILDFCDIHG